MARVVLKNVTKRFDDVEAVKNVSIEIKDKEFLVLVGPSGCGKTTILRMIAGLEEITEGNIHIGNKLVNEVAPKDRNIAMVFQNYALYPHMSVFDNMSFGLRLSRTPKPEIHTRVNEAAEILGLAKLLDRLPKQLSGGQRQRVALGRAIVRNPQVFLMDEPLSNLDAKLRVQMRAEIKKIHNKLGVTIIYVTHDQVEAMTLGDRIAVILNGEIQQAEEPLRVYDNPSNRFVGGFIGSPPMNFINGNLSKSGENISFICESFQITLPKDYSSILSAHIGKDIILGVRPENIRDHNTGSYMVDPFKLETKVDFRELMGSDTYLYLKAGVISLVARVEALDIARGSKFEVLIDLRKIHIFDKETQNTIL